MDKAGERHPTLLEKALGIALEAHQGQTDRQGAAYILHPLRLLAKFRDPTLQLIAILHDVVEDSPVTLQNLLDEGFSQTVVDAVDALTRRPEEPYEHLIARAAENDLAKQIKLADLEDHMGLCRYQYLDEEGMLRSQRYHRAYRILTAPQAHV